MSALRGAMGLLGMAMSIGGIALHANPALGQILPPPGASAPGLGELLTHPDAWLTGMFNSALVSIAQKTTGDIVAFLDWLLGSGNVISQTPAALSYDNTAVKTLWETIRVIGNAALAVVTVWTGVNLMVHPHIRAPYHGALELIPRVVLSGIMLNYSLGWGSFVVKLNNELCRYIGGGSMPGWGVTHQQVPNAGGVLLNLIAMAIYLVMGLLLTGQMMMRLALVDALLVIAPLALVCWVLPQTYGWARLWFSTFFGTVFVQAVQVLVLRLGTDLIQQLPTLLQSMGSGQADAARIWLVTLFMGIAVLQLARKVPRLMPGFPGGITPANPATGGVRQLAAVFNTASGKRGGRGK